MYDIVLSASDSEHCASKTCSKKGMSSACNHKHVVIQEESHIAMSTCPYASCSRVIFLEVKNHLPAGDPVLQI